MFLNEALSVVTRMSFEAAGASRMFTRDLRSVTRHHPFNNMIHANNIYSNVPVVHLPFTTSFLRFIACFKSLIHKEDGVRVPLNCRRPSGITKIAVKIFATAQQSMERGGHGHSLARRPRRPETNAGEPA